MTQLWEAHDPHRGDTILRIGPDDQPNGLVTRVERIVSFDRSLEVWEIIDKENQTRFIERAADEYNDNTWIEVAL